MTADKALNILGAIVTVALVTTIVARPNSIGVIRAIGDFFTGAVKAGLGQGVNFK